MTATSSLQFYLHNDPDALRMELAGRLSGVDVESAFHAWQIEIDRDPFRRFIADISFVTGADEHGLVLLALWHRLGAEIIAHSKEALAIVEPIRRQRIESAVPKRGFLRRLFGFLLEVGHEEVWLTTYVEAAIRASLRDNSRHTERTSWACGIRPVLAVKGGAPTLSDRLGCGGNESSR